MKKIWLDGMMGVVVGDALGMPVQFMARHEVKANPVTGMEGYGTYNMPPGTWSDDSSMALATLVSIREKQGIDYDDIMERFVRWTMYGEYTPAGIAFDQGATCMGAINNYIEGRNYKTCGKVGERANGNGALMRIMPVCLYSYEEYQAGNVTLAEALEYVHQVSALTHNHLRSKIGCGIYYFMISNLLDGEGSLRERLQAGVDEAIKFYHEDSNNHDDNHDELAHYSRLFHLDEFRKCNEDEIKSSGYVVASLEAAVWSLITTDTLEASLLKAVNLGDDADTVGAIAGGLAGVYYGYDAIPGEWREEIIKREWIEKITTI